MNIQGSSRNYGSTCAVIYPASGLTIDFTYSVDIKYFFTTELGGEGLDPPREEIKLSYEEFWHGITAMVAAIEERERERYQTNKKYIKKAIWR
ncbi:DgyrCDS9174 [Dimorphilus gyrociliatus]|uniref:DgyrCDS9174 n=1 Tax=Dimorphilus gyrociliatus TaxID=2664684 RepID=A0A7I8W1H9_9ANNE|nr:DgyrCDS9174 [Dimorphilus gyrociliatus]